MTLAGAQFTRDISERGPDEGCATSLTFDLCAVQSGFPDCRTVLYGDLETGTVLRVAAADGQHQEDHDAILAEAVALLGPAGLQLLRARTERAATVYGGEVRLHMRGANGAVVSAVCGPKTPLGALEAELAALVARHE